MLKIASIGLSIGVFTVIAHPVQAEDQSVYFATGAIGGEPAYARVRAPYGGYPYAGYVYGPYGSYAYPYGGYPYGYAQRNCTYVGGPKGSVGWTC